MTYSDVEPSPDDFMMRALCTALLLSAVAATATAGQETSYTISFPNAMHREAEVTVTWTSLPSQPLAVRMSRSSPGRYALHEFIKNVYSVRATDGAGRELEVEQPDPYGWTIAGHDGTVKFSYTLYGDRADGTYAAIDATHAHLNMPATFAFAHGTETRPIRVTFDVPEGSSWQVATQLEPTDDPYTFTAPHLQYFLDSPTELSDFTQRSWEVTGNAGETYTIRLAVHHAGSEAAVDGYAEMAKAVVAEQIAMWGEPPDFDFGTYTFLADYLPYASGDGMEHRNSTVISSSSSLEENALGLLGTLSHEFFHSWNVERLRPHDLEPFDFENANMSGLLWFAEGFTNYYDGLFIRRAGLIDDGRFATDLGNLLNGTINPPGRRYHSPVQMSRQAPFVDAAVSIDPQNRANTFISYYTWGSAIGLGLDLTLRTRFDLTLDDFMRAMWTRFGRNQENFAPARPYTIDDLRSTLAEVTGDRAFADQFFDSYVLGRDVPDYEPLLAAAGFVLRLAAPERASIGNLQLQARDGRVVVTGSTLVGTPAYEAGLDRGDVLVSFDQQPVRDPVQLGELIGGKRPGETVEIEYEHRGQRRTARVRLVADPRLEVVPFETAGREVTPEITAFRSSWLESRAR